jgi:hypothetical protein
MKRAYDKPTLVKGPTLQAVTAHLAIVSAVAQDGSSS